LTLQRWCPAIEDEYRLDTKEQKLAYTPEEAYDVGISESVSFFVPHGFKELVYPYRGIDCEAFAVQAFELDGTGAWLHYGP
jgi:hypothetical protein